MLLKNNVQIKQLKRIRIADCKSINKIQNSSTQYKNQNIISIINNKTNEMHNYEKSKHLHYLVNTPLLRMTSAQRLLQE